MSHKNLNHCFDNYFKDPWTPARSEPAEENKNKTSNDKRISTYQNMKYQTNPMNRNR